MISFRPILKEDAPFVVSLRNSVANLLHDNRRFKEAEFVEWLKSKNPNWFILVNSNGNNVGYFRTLRISDSNGTSIFIGCDILEPFRRQKIATEAYLLLINMLSKPFYGFTSFKARVLSHNYQSIAFHSKFGFEIVNVIPEYIKRDGKVLQDVTFELKV